MPRISNIDIIRKPAMKRIFIRQTTSVDKLAQLIGESYGKMAVLLQEKGIELCDMPYAAYHNMDMQSLDIELGFPILREIEVPEGIELGDLPEQRVLMTLHLGAYDGMEPTYQDMMQHVKEHNLPVTGLVYESYLNGPPYPTEQMVTMVMMPLRD